MEIAFVVNVKPHRLGVYLLTTRTSPRLSSVGGWTNARSLMTVSPRAYPKIVRLAFFGAVIDMPENANAEFFIGFACEIERPTAPIGSAGSLTALSSMDNGSDSPTPPGEVEPDRASQRVARLVLAVVLVLLGLWILHRYLTALGWAAVLAIALWPVYRRLVQALGGRTRRVVVPLLLTLAVGLIFIIPFVYAAVEVAREIHVLVQYLVDAQRTGIPVPGWVTELPGIGYPIEEWWRTNLSAPEAAEQLLGRIYAQVPAESAREVGDQILHRLILFGFTMLALFFLIRDGNALSHRLIGLSDRVLGAQGERVGRRMVQAVVGAVNGLVLVGLGEGFVLGIAYISAGLPRPVSAAVLTGILAVIPFGAPVVFSAAALYLAATGSTAAGIAVLVTGFAVVFIADHFIRPALIGGAIRLPFLWVLFGILGGLETFGILGLFIGPAIMAALMSLWRDWTDPHLADDAVHPPRPEEGAP